MNDREEEWTPEPHQYTWPELALVLVLIVFVLVEFATMWTWCLWFTQCPKG